MNSAKENVKRHIGNMLIYNGFVISFFCVIKLYYSDYLELFEQRCHSY